MKCVNSPRRLNYSRSPKNPDLFHQPSTHNIQIQHALREHGLVQIRKCGMLGPHLSSTSRSLPTNCVLRNMHCGPFCPEEKGSSATSLAACVCVCVCVCVTYINQRLHHKHTPKMGSYLKLDRVIANFNAVVPESVEPVLLHTCIHIHIQVHIDTHVHIHIRINVHMRIRENTWLSLSQMLREKRCSIC